MSPTPEPVFTTERRDEKPDAVFEVRNYPPMLVAEVMVAGNREDAANAGFRQLFDYIDGANAARKDIPMTAPVRQQTGGQKIPMTAPVLQQAKDGEWRVQFVMPAGYTLATLPKPINPAVILAEVPEQRFAVIRFSGRSTPDNLSAHLKKLQDWAAANKLVATGEPVYAFYNPPWTLPFARRNEIMLLLPPA